jgi:uncharacterized protein (UPF0297 family)
MKRDGNMTKQEKENCLCVAYRKLPLKGKNALDRIVEQLVTTDTTEIKQILIKGIGNKRVHK